ncbi:MAG: hypothetical protein H7346_27615 [Burkholderiaceae bacterium]|nr:hypothetical protein [Burkholderiaceae bacterium]
MTTDTHSGAHSEAHSDADAGAEQQLDEDELLHLAMHASGQDRHDLAIGYLKQIVHRNPRNAIATYLLGAEHAQIGLYPRAMEEMQRAVDMAPTLYAARLQLGLLYLTSAMVEESVATLAPLQDLGDENFYSCFSQGLQHLIRDEFADCRHWLQKGMGLNDENLALNGDMQRILDALPAEAAAGVGSTTPGAPGLPGVAGKDGKNWLSAYQGDDDSASL